MLDDGTPLRPGVPANPRRNINLAQGADLELRVDVVTPLGTPVRLAGGSAVLTVKRRPDERPRIEKTVGTFVGNRATFLIAPADTKRLQPGLFSWDVWLTLSGKRDPVVPLSPWNLQASNARIP